MSAPPCSIGRDASADLRVVAFAGLVVLVPFGFLALAMFVGVLLEDELDL